MRLASYFMYVSGIAFVTLAIVGYLKDPRIYMAHLGAAVFGVILCASGIAAHRIAVSRDQQPSQALQRKAGSSVV